MKKVIEIIRVVWRFILKYNEWFFSFPLGIVLMYYGTIALRKNGFQMVYDLGILQKLFIGFAFFFFSLGMTRLILRMMWPFLSRLIDEDTNGKWKNIPFVHIVWICVVLFCVVLHSLSNLIGQI